MLSSKRIFVSLPSYMLSEVDRYTSLDRKNRSQIVMEALDVYLGERRRISMVEEMKRGYEEMATINLEFACESCHWEEEALVHSISKLLGRT